MDDGRHNSGSWHDIVSCHHDAHVERDYVLASVCAARASACVSMYSWMRATLPSRTVMSKTHASLNGLFVALIFPVATPTTITRSPCATNSAGFGYCVSTSSDAFLSKAANSACPRCVPASG